MIALDATYPFWLSFFFVFMAEMGDKTQLVSLTFATRYPATTVLGGVSGATLLVHLFSVVLGEGVGRALPVFWVRLIAGVAFIGFGVWTLRGDRLSDRNGTILVAKRVFFQRTSLLFTRCPRK